MNVGGLTGTPGRIVPISEEDTNRHEVHIVSKFEWKMLERSKDIAGRSLLWARYEIGEFLEV